MFMIFEVTLVIVNCYLLFFIILFLTKLLRENRKQQRKSKTSEEITRVAEKNRSKCTMLGFLEKLPKGDPIPKECLICQKLVECFMAKRAFDWYLGQDSAQTSENEEPIGQKRRSTFKKRGKVKFLRGANA